MPKLTDLEQSRYDNHRCISCAGEDGRTRHSELYCAECMPLCDKPKYHKPSTLCWSCANAVPSMDGKVGCEWSISLKPVPGWLAEYESVMDAGKIHGSHLVLACPKFKEG